MIHTRITALVGAVVLALSLTSTASPAQSLEQQTRALPGASTNSAPGVQESVTGPSRFISTNPFLPLFGFFSAEYEQRLKDNLSFAVSGSSVKFDERVTNLDFKLRLYPNDRALDGIGLAASLGVANLGREQKFAEGGAALPRTSFVTPSFAIEIGYQWLLGRSKGTAVTAGFGAKRYLGGSNEDFDGISRVLPTGRLSIGYGF